MNLFEKAEKLKRELTDKYVKVDSSRPELARFQDAVGQVKTVNMSGRALVEFDQYLNIGWYDIDPSFLSVVPKPEKTEEKPSKAAGATKKKPAQPAAKAAPMAKPKAKSTADILAAARAGKGAAAPATSSDATKAAEKKPAAGGKMSVADVLAAARAEKGGGTASPPKEETAPAAKSAPEPTQPSAKPDRSKMSVADILAAARGEKQPAGGGSSSPAAESVEETAVSEPVEETAQAEESPPAEEVVSPAPGDAGSETPKGELPQSTADIIAWCRDRDASG